MRIAFKVVAILEGAGLTLVSVNSEHSRRRLCTHQRPFAACGKTRAAKTAQPSIAYDLDQLVARAFVGEAGFEQRVTAGFLVNGEIGVGLPRVRVRFCLDRPRHRRGRSVESLNVTHCADRCAVARAHTRRAHHANITTKSPRKFLQQLLGTSHRAGKGIAYTHGDRRRRQLAFSNHIKMRVKCRDLVNFRERHLHLGSECREMCGREIPIVILDEMKMLDQEIAASRPVSKQRAHLRKRLWINLAALWRAWRTAAATARGDLSRLGPLCSDVHPFSFSPTKTRLNRGACKPYPPPTKPYDRDFLSIPRPCLYFFDHVAVITCAGAFRNLPK